MTDAELDLLMRDVLLDSLKLDDKSVLDEVVEFIPSRRHQKQVHFMLSNPEKWMRGKTRPMWQKITQRVAVFVLIVLLNFSVIMAASPTVRAAVLQWIVEWYETHISFQYFGTEKPEDMPQYHILDLPGGYVEIERIGDMLSADVLYENDKGEFLYLSYSYMNQDIENVFIPGDDEIIEISVNQMKGYLFIPQDPESRRSITWIDEENNIQFIIDAMLDKADLIRMAESVTLNK